MTHCLILAAGEGKRLRPLTNESPKSLVELLEKPIIKYQIDTLMAVGIKDIAIVTGYKAEKFSPFGFKTYHNELYNFTNMVRSLFAARPFLEQVEEDIIITYGDIVYEKKNLEILLSTPGDVVTMIDDGWIDLWSARNENPLSDAETLKYDKHGYIIELGKKPKSLSDIKGQYTGLTKISYKKVPSFISFYDNLNNKILYDGQTFNQMYMTSLLQLMINGGWKIVPAHVDHGWLEIDTVKDLRLYERLSKEGKLDKLWRVDA